MEPPGEAFEIGSHLHNLAVGTETQQQIKQQRDEDAGHRGVHHVADVRKEVGTCHGRCQHGSVAHGRHLVTEVGSGDDGTRRVGRRYPQGITYAHQRNADGPRGARHQRDNRCNHAGTGQEKEG